MDDATPVEVNSTRRRVLTSRSREPVVVEEVRVANSPVISSRRSREPVVVEEVRVANSPVISRRSISRRRVGVPVTTRSSRVINHHQTQPVRVTYEGYTNPVVRKASNVVLRDSRYHPVTERVSIVRDTHIPYSYYTTAARPVTKVVHEYVPTLDYDIDSAVKRIINKTMRQC